MSGKRQHFIPRFLLSGFASHTSGEQVFTWVFRKHATPFNTNIINVGVEGLFYSQEDDHQADDNITAVEGPFADLIGLLRNGEAEALACRQQIAVLIAHLEMRTRHIRQSFTLTHSAIFDAVMNFVEDRDAFRDYLARKIKSEPSFMQEAMAAEFKKRNIPDTLLPYALANIEPHLDNILLTAVANMSAITIQLRKALPSMLKNGSKTGHIKALKETVSPEIKAKTYEGLKFQLIETKESLMILGDSILIFQTAGTRKFKPFWEPKDILQAIYLPLSPHIVLVGTNSGHIPDVSLLPLAIAQCSLEFFIGHSEQSANDDLLAHMGESSYLLSQVQIEALLASSINK
ncbi:DUF4238 domain-containing protein [Alcaligenaceae bacterium CGII-47]|nr:DUF4238 domain-containing protein [Alcaligenaceae bacterium CGII-47]